MCRCVSALCPDPLSTLHLPKMCLGDYLPLPIWRFASCLGRPSCLISEADARCYPVIRCPHLKAFFFSFFFQLFHPKLLRTRGSYAVCGAFLCPELTPRRVCMESPYGLRRGAEHFSIISCRNGRLSGPPYS